MVNMFIGVSSDDYCKLLEYFQCSLQSVRLVKKCLLECLDSRQNSEAEELPPQIPQYRMDFHVEKSNTSLYNTLHVMDILSYC